MVETRSFAHRAVRLGDAIRRLVRRGSRRNLSRLLSKVRPEDLGQLLDALTPAEQLYVFKLAIQDYLPVAGDVLIGMEPSQMLSLLHQLTPREIARVVKPMAVDDAAMLVDSLEEPLRDEVLQLVDLQDIGELQAHLTYAEDSAGRLMNTEFFALSEDTEVAEAVERLRGAAEVEMVFYVYVVSSEGKLVGVTSLRQLLLAKPQQTLGEIMTRSLIVVGSDTDQEEVARLASRYDLLAIPVVDEQGVLIGIVTVDDIVDVVQEEADEDMMKMVGTSDDELWYGEQSWRVARIRLPWLLINLSGLFITGLLFKYFEVTLTQALFLLFFAPVIMGMGGNIGSQTSTIAVRGMATGRLVRGQGRSRAFLKQQLRVGLLLGSICAPIAATVALVLERNLALSLLVAMSLFVAVSLAAINGSLIPLLFERVGIDPAVAAGPMVSTASDWVGIVVYFGLAAALMSRIAG